MSSFFNSTSLSIIIKFNKFNNHNLLPFHNHKLLFRNKKVLLFHSNKLLLHNHKSFHSDSVGGGVNNYNSNDSTHNYNYDHNSNYSGDNNLQTSIPKYYEIHETYIPQKSATLPNEPEFYPGRQSMLRMEEFYHSTLADDVTILTYRDPKTEEQFIAKRKKQYLPQKKWVLTRDTNPYAKNRPRPRPRGNKTVGPVPPMQSHKTVPQLTRIVVHCMMKQALSNKQHLLSGIMALQCITSERPSIVYSKSNVARWKLRKGITHAIFNMCIYIHSVFFLYIMFTNVTYVLLLISYRNADRM